MPRKEVFRKEEWVFFLNADGELRYCDKCNNCRRSCKQSFRAVIVRCPRFESKGEKDEEG